MLKKCSKCGTEKPHTAEFYYRDKRAKSGLYSACKKCTDLKTRAHQKKNSEWWRKYSREFYQNNKERLLEKRRQRFKKNPQLREVSRRATKRWHEKNVERVLRVNRKRGRDRTENLEDCYVARVLCKSFGFKNTAAVPAELIILKRQHILLYREIQEKALTALKPREPKELSLAMISKQHENPCRTCPIHLGGEDKNGDECMRCGKSGKRSEYVEQTEKML